MLEKNEIENGPEFDLVSTHEMIKELGSRFCKLIVLHPNPKHPEKTVVHVMTPSVNKDLPYDLPTTVNMLTTAIEELTFETFNNLDKEKDDSDDSDGPQNDYIGPQSPDSRRNDADNDDICP